MLNFFHSFKARACLIILTTIVVYGCCINNLNLWSDELYSVLMAKDSFSEMWVLLTTEDSKPPLYYLYLKGIIALFPANYEIWAAHFASYILLIGAQIFAVTEIRKDYGDKLALWLAFLMAILPCSLWLAFEVRTYMLSAFLLLVAAIYGLRLLEKPRLADFIKFGVVSVLALYTHYYCAIALMFLYLGIFICLIYNKTFAVYGKKFILTSFLVALTFCPWLIIPFTTGKEISQSWYVNWDFVKYSPLFFINPFRPEIIQSKFIYATNLVTETFSLIVISGMFILGTAEKKVKKLYWFSLGTFLASYFLLIGLSFAIRPMVTARYLKIYACLWYIAGAVVLTVRKNLAKVFCGISLLLFGFSYADIRAISFDKEYANAVRDIRSFIPKDNKLITLDNANLFVEYYLPEYVALHIVGEKGEILRLPSVMKNIEEYSEKVPEISFVLSIYHEINDTENCISFNSLYRKGQKLSMCKMPKILVKKMLLDSLNLRLKKY